MIAVTVAEWTNGAADWRILGSIAQRESNFVPTATGDVAIAKTVWERLKPTFVEKRNPYTNLDADFSASRGLYQMMVPYHLPKWSWRAHPLALNHPVVATVMAGRLVHAILKAGARNAVDVRMVWAYGTDGLQIPRTDERYISRLESEENRMQKLGWPRELATSPLQAYNWRAFGLGEERGQDAKALALAQQLGLPPWAGASGNDTPPSDNDSGWGGIAALAMLAASVMGGMRGT